MHQPPACSGRLRSCTSTDDQLICMRHEQVTNQILQSGSARHLLRARGAGGTRGKRFELVPHKATMLPWLGFSFCFTVDVAAGTAVNPVICIWFMFEDTPFQSKTAGKPYGHMVQEGTAFRKPTFASDKPSAYPGVRGIQYHT
ncbi:hypothetical protein RJZ56_000574 [Blastomyces dermatitidis]